MKELGVSSIRFAHYQQADIMFSLSDQNGMVVWAEIPNTPKYRNTPEYLANCKSQLTELIKQNYNHPSIIFWGLYNEIDIPAEDVQLLHDTAKRLDPNRLTTQADFVHPQERYAITDVVAWNWYFGWYYDKFYKYADWYDDLHKNYPNLKAGFSEYGASASINHQQLNPERPDPFAGRFFLEQYQTQYHEEVWKNIKDRNDIWGKYIWNMYDFSWTTAVRGDKPYRNYKGLITHDRKNKKDAFYFYKANWSEEPVIHIKNSRLKTWNTKIVQVEVYTNLDEVELLVNGKTVANKKMDSEIHKITFENVELKRGHNRIDVIGKDGDLIYTDYCEWDYVE
jgi:beta-galactosidase